MLEAAKTTPAKTDRPAETAAAEGTKTAAEASLANADRPGIDRPTGIDRLFDNGPRRQRRDPGRRIRLAHDRSDTSLLHHDRRRGAARAVIRGDIRLLQRRR